MYQLYYKCPVGQIKLTADDKYILGVEFINRKVKNSSDLPKHLLLAKSQLDEYFAKKRNKFDLPLKLEGTDFQKKVWKKLEKIPFGKTKSYKDLANEIKNPKSVRAVGGANNKNKFAIFIPCHRVIGANGSLTGYAGGLKFKEYLLQHEGAL